MPNKTLIEWTDYTSNGVIARVLGVDKSGWFCDKPDKDGGCLHCYAESLNLRWGNGLRFDKANRKLVEFSVRVKEQSDLLKLNEKKQGSKVFVGDMFDLFQPSIPVNILNELFDTYDSCKNLSLQFLTKYPARMSHFFSERYYIEPPEHFWIGASAATQEWLMKTFVNLAHIRGRRYLSLEPLLGPINIKHQLHLLHWVIIGGESGAGARPCDIHWIGSIVDQCKAANVPVFVKQLGSKPFMGVKGFGPVINSSKGGDITEWPKDLQVREFPR